MERGMEHGMERGTDVNCRNESMDPINMLIKVGVNWSWRERVSRAVESW